MRTSRRTGWSQSPVAPFLLTPLTIHLRADRSVQLEMQIYSPSLQPSDQPRDNFGTLAVFSEHDQISGRVVLDPSCSHSGRLSISVSGS